ncbi:MAG: hypothetical protein HQL08_12440 [Nitrospirae bacterium]|nr:hypothetical protein [Nitrospirota bacterium]
MAINPVNNAPLVPPQALPKQGGNVNVNNKVNNPAVAPQSKVANDGDDTGVKKAAEVQPQESKSKVQATINKFA